MTGAELFARVERFPTAGVWTISRGSVTEVEVVVVEARLGGAVGRGECRPYPRYGWTAESVTAEIEAVAHEVSAWTDAARWDLSGLMPADAARNAVDCALWDLRAKRSGRRVWELANLPEPRPQITAFTLSLDTPERMRDAAARQAHRPLLKVKLGGEDDMARLEAVRAGAPDSTIIVDANEGWTAELYSEFAPHLKRLGVALVEQPLPAGADEALAGIERPVPVCADESCHDRASLPGLAGKYDVINIKLDKTGGLTEALRLRDAAREAGFGIMVGCMVGSSLAMAPAVLAAQGAAFTDLDGPLLLARDRDRPLRYDGDGVHPPEPELWG